MQTTDITTTEAASDTKAKTEEALIREAIAGLRPTLLRDGGDIQLHKIQGDMVVVEMTGACVGCVLASVTVAGVRKIISEKVGRPMRVIPRSAFIPLERMRGARKSATGRSVRITEHHLTADIPA